MRRLSSKKDNENHENKFRTTQCPDKISGYWFRMDRTFQIIRSQINKESNINLNIRNHEKDHHPFTDRSKALRILFQFQREQARTMERAQAILRLRGTMPDKSNIQP